MQSSRGMRKRQLEDSVKEPKIWMGALMAGAVLALFAAVPALLLTRGAGAAVPPTDVDLSLDCDTAVAGIQATCAQAAAGSRDIAVILRNNTTTDTTLSAFNFDVLGDNSPVFTPNPATAVILDSNPDANQAGYPTLGCSLPHRLLTINPPRRRP